MLENTILIILVALVLLYLINRNYNKEHMSLGVVQQMYAQDTQNIALNGDDNRYVQSGDYVLRYNQPGRMTNRGSPRRGNNKIVYYNDGYTGDYGILPDFDITRPLGPPNVIRIDDNNIMDDHSNYRDQ
jgi:hypothetical protein